MFSRARSFFDNLDSRLTVGEKLAALIAISAVAAATLVGWRVYQTQADQIHSDFEHRALIVSRAVEAAAVNYSVIETEQDRLDQLIRQQNHIEALTAREPAVLRIDVYAPSDGDVFIVGSSERDRLIATPSAEDREDLAEVFELGAEVVEEEEVLGENAYELMVPLNVDGQAPLAIGVYLSTSDRDAALAAVQRTFAITVAVAAAGVVVALYTAVWLFVSKRLRRLGHAAGRMRHGDYSARVPGASAADARDEIVSLTADFNSMAASIERLHAQTTELAITDPLTDVYNRRYFLDALQREIERSRRSGDPLAVVMLDLDGFKAVNDRYGHIAGDETLVHIAHALKSAARAGDVTARFGGDEFVALLPNCDSEDLATVMERIRSHIDQLAPPRVGDGEVLHVTVSAGGALLREDDTVDSLMHRADLALFEAKNSGRNQVRVAA